MKKKVMILFMIFIILLVGIAFASSYVKAVSRQEELQARQELLNCQQNENCPIYQENNYCIRQDNHHHSHKNYNCIQDCNRQQNCSKRMCNR